MRSGYHIHGATDATTWHALLSLAADPHITQSWAWGEAKQASVDRRTRRVLSDIGGWRVRRVIVSRDGEPVAICQLLDKVLAGVSAAWRVNRGPLFLDADPGEDTLKGVYGALRQVSLQRRRPLVIAPALRDSPEACRLIRDLGYRPRRASGWCSDRVDLRPEEQQMHRTLHRDWRRGVQRAEKAGVEFRVSESIEDLEWIIERHVQHRMELQFAGMQPTLLRALRAAAPSDDFIVSQVLLGGEPVGGVVTLRFGRAAEGLVFWVGQEGRRADAGRYLDWRTALELKRRGCEWLDLGGKRSGATEQYKGGMGGVAYRLLNEWTAW